MNRKGQINAIITFSIVVIILILVAPILVKIVVTPASRISTAFETADPTNQSSNAIGYIQNKFTSMIDWVIAFFFLFNTLILLVSAFLVDVHPAFLIIYIIAAFFLVMFAPMTMDAIGKIYNSPSFNAGSDNVIQYLPITNFLYENFTLVLLGIIILSGVILFGKYKLGAAGRSNAGGASY